MFDFIFDFIFDKLLCIIVVSFIRTKIICKIRPSHSLADKIYESEEEEV